VRAKWQKKHLLQRVALHHILARVTRVDAIAVTRQSAVSHEKTIY
jgi:hypothetical protein